MKKGKVFTKQSIIMLAMVLALGAAVWLNMRYSASTTAGNTSKYLGEALLVDNSKTDETVETSGSVDQDNLEKAAADREASRKEQTELIEETLQDAKLSDDVKKAAVERLAKLTESAEKENSAETVLDAKGFKNSVVVISDDNVSVIVKSDGLLASETVQIQDAVTSNTGIPLEKIKIVTVK